MPLIYTDKKYKYDVAFSFMERDKALAIELRDLIKSRPTNFIYSEHQVDLTGTDGRDSFRKVFLEDSRVVVILYREEWGTTPMTKIEHDAIKEKRWKESAGFIVLINLDRGKPDWYGDPYIRYYLEEYGIEAAASAIHKKIQEYGGELHVETPEEMAARFSREENRKEIVKKYLDSPQGSTEGHAEAVRFGALMRARAQAFTQANTNYSISHPQYDEGVNQIFIMAGNETMVHALWHRLYSNNLAGAYLLVILGKPSRNQWGEKRFVRDGAVIKDEARYTFTLDHSDVKGWTDEKKKGSFFTSEQLIEEWLTKLIARLKVDRDEQEERERKWRNGH
ncbi:MAG: hypothetical protein WBB32_11245 [Flavobacteriales bacterium]